MSDLIPGGNYTPTNMLAKQGMTAVGGIAGGVALLIMSALPPIVGIIVGVVVGIVGIGGILSKDPDDKKPGVLAAVAGGLSIFSKVGIVRPLAGTLLGIGAIGLLGLGIWNGVKFLRGLKSRS